MMSAPVAAAEPDRSTGSPSRSLAVHGPSIWTLAFWIAAVAVFALVLVWARDGSFWADEWKFIDERLAWDVHAFMDPHWGHPVIGEALVWKPLLSTIGLISYTPYVAAVAAAHVIVAAGVYHIVRRSAGDPVGFAAALVLLLLGSGGQAILVPLSLNLTGALAAGIWALALFVDGPTRRGLVAISVLLVIAILFSGAGLYAIATIATLSVLIVGRRREGLTVLPALGLFVGWRYLFDRSSMTGGLTEATPQQLLDFVKTGLSHAIGSVSGLGDEVGLIVAVLLAVGTLWHLLGRRPLLVGVVGGFVGMVSVYGITALARAHLVDPDGTNAADPSRYIYLAAPFLLIACASWLGLRPRIELRSARQVLPVLALLAVSIVINAPQLPHWGRFLTDQGTLVRAAILVMREHAGSPALPDDVRPPTPPGVWLGDMPAPRRLLEILDAYGSPTDPDPFSSGRAPVSPEAIERVLIGFMHDAYRVEGASAPIDGVTPPEVVTVTDATVMPDGTCLAATPDGPVPSIVLAVPGGQSLSVSTSERGEVAVSLSADGTFSTPDTRPSELVPGRAVVITVPDLDADWPWQVRLEFPDAGPLRVCATDPGV